MSTRINHNLLSMTAQRNIHLTQMDMDKAITRLSSGLRINNSWDDPAGLAISERMRAQISSLVEAERNANYNVNLLATAEGAMSVIDEKLIRLRSLAVQASNGALTSLDRSALNVEFQQLKSEIDRIANTTNYNGLNLLNGDFSTGSTGIKFHIDKLTRTIELTSEILASTKPFQLLLTYRGNIETIMSRLAGIALCYWLYIMVMTNAKPHEHLLVITRDSTEAITYLCFGTIGLVFAIFASIFIIRFAYNFVLDSIHNIFPTGLHSIIRSSAFILILFITISHTGNVKAAGLTAYKQFTGLVKTSQMETSVKQRKSNAEVLENLAKKLNSGNEF